MHELIAHGWLDDDYIARHVDAAGRRCASARCSGRPSARPTRAASTPSEVRALARDYGTTAPGRDPPELRHAARARRRQRGAADRDPAVPHRRLARIAPAACCCRARAGSATCATTPRCSGPTCSPARRPRTINMSTIGDDLLREGGAVAPTAALRAAHRGARRLQQQPGRGGARVAEGRARLRARGPVHRRARALHDRHRRPCRLRAAGDDAARAPRRAHELRPHLRADQRAGDRAARRGEAEHADLPRAGRAHGLRRAVLRATTTRRSRAPAVPRAKAVDFDALRARGWVKLPICPTRRSPTAASRRRTASAASTRPDSGVPDYVPNYESAAQHARARGALSRWR